VGSSGTARRKVASIQDDRHGPVVHELHRHPRPKRPPLDRNALVDQRVAEAVVERFGELGRSGFCEARTVSSTGVLCLSEVNRKIRGEL
jgi:hypothetical protein